MELKIVDSVFEKINKFCCNNLDFVFDAFLTYLWPGQHFAAILATKNLVGFFGDVKQGPNYKSIFHIQLNLRI